MRTDVNDEKLYPGCLVVGDSGRVYCLAEEQTACAGDAIRVHPVTLRRGRWVIDFERVQAQHGNLVVLISPSELEEQAHGNERNARRTLERYYEERRPRRRAEFVERQRTRRRSYDDRID